MPSRREIDYNPYLPGMAIFGIPHALFGGTPLADGESIRGKPSYGASRRTPCSSSRSSPRWRSRRPSAVSIRR
ncbi:hypothetical protein WKI71_22870 [Streptomyces sp. MS1.AVA.1]|uniref:Uncharacterized protein n=1 Tax=Streptomyces machairae TaxID=3134109 RepID=A0ABU8UPY0_9ACTN